LKNDALKGLLVSGQPVEDIFSPQALQNVKQGNDSCLDAEIIESVVTAGKGVVHVTPAGAMPLAETILASRFVDHI